MRTNRKNGFTLIEIILVLALACILLLMVLTALSGAQRARRDAQRKQDLAIFYAKLEEYSANNQNSNLCPSSSVHDQFPCDDATLANFVATYFSGHTDPLTGNPYVVNYWENTHHRRPVPGEILYGREHLCYVNGNDIIADVINGKPTDFSHDHYMMVYQENGKYFCLDNRIQ
jgi:prepilin-type N-terminal cleavage/methylation domain-containing protein